ncbi:MAG: hypothetical protein RJB39_642 [Candidatus Parcubacteria bacterium]|jgi:biopolymer transport protein ExbD
MKKILLLIVLILVIIFVGKYVYDKQKTGAAVSLANVSNSAQVSGSKDQFLTIEKGKRGDILVYNATIKVVNPTKQATSAITFLNMPVLFKLNAAGQYQIATSVRPTGIITEEGTNTITNLNGPIYVIGAGAMKRFTVNASFTDLPPGTYRVSLGASGIGNWSGYSINGGALQPLPTSQTNSVTIATSTLAAPR